MTPPRRNKLIVIGGPTASGKTSLAIEIAQLLNTQILSADSRQCYKELEIGTAKPNKSELESVPHHFINSHSIHDEVSVGDYMRYGLDKLSSIFKESEYAVCVGGTGLYIKALCEGLDAMPPVDKLIKQQLENKFEQEGVKWLQQELKEKDPHFLSQTDASNPMRLLRALIFFDSHNKSILSFQKAKKQERDFDVLYYTIEIPREKLYERINLRVDQMIEKGLFDEVRTLEQYKHLKALQTVGYKEIFEHLAGNWTLEKAIDKIKQHSRNYAKRQLTWFKNQGEYQLLNPNKVLESVQSTICR